MITTPNFQAAGLNIIVKIDKAAQKKKAFISKFIQVPPQFEYMLYNLQYGEVVSIGPQVKRPELKLGVEAIFHHRIEAEDRCLIHEFENGDQLRWLPTHSEMNSHQYFGVIDHKGNILPAKEYVLTKPYNEEEEGYEEFDAKNESDEAGGLVGIGFKAKVKKTGLLFSAKTFHAEEEQEKIFIQLTVTHTPPAEKWVQPGDRIQIEAWAQYPIDIKGEKYMLVLRQFIIGKITTV